MSEHTNHARCPACGSTLEPSDFVADVAPELGDADVDVRQCETIRCPQAGAGDPSRLTLFVVTGEDHEEHPRAEDVGCGVAYVTDETARAVGYADEDGVVHLEEPIR